jgi:hypothetical protein
LNITAIFWRQDWLGYGEGEDDEWYTFPYGYWWKTDAGEMPFHNYSTPMFTDGQWTYDLDQLNVAGRCQQTDATYKWGFSFLVLFIVVVLFFSWSLGMYILWLDAYFNSRFDRAGRTMGLQRAIVDLAYCIQKDTGEDGNEMASNAELQAKIRRGLNGGRITYQMLDDKALPLTRAAELRLRWRQTSVKEWFKDRMFVLALFVGSLGYLAAALAGTHTPLFTAFLLVYGTGALVVMGKRHPSRWFIFLASTVVAIALGPVGPYVYLDRHHYTVIWLRQNAYDTISWWFN